MSVWDYFGVGFGLLLAAAILAGAFSLTSGCNSTLTHEIAIKVDLDDPCLTAFPECGAGGGTFCWVPEPGVPGGQLVKPECRVTCVASRELVCMEDGPHCVQVVGDETQDLPVFCMRADR